MTNPIHNSNFDAHENVETLVPLLKLEVEDGSTETSLKNAEMLIEAYGRPTYVRLTHDAKAGYVVVVRWVLNKGEYSRPFLGFSWGYGGEGPNGLVKFFEMARIPGFSITDIIHIPSQVDKVAYCSEFPEKPIRTLHRNTSPASELPPEGSDLIRDTFGE